MYLLWKQWSWGYLNNRACYSYFIVKAVIMALSEQSCLLRSVSKTVQFCDLLNRIFSKLNPRIKIVGDVNILFLRFWMLIHMECYLRSFWYQKSWSKKSCSSGTGKKQVVSVKVSLLHCALFLWKFIWWIWSAFYQNWRNY